MLVLDTRTATPHFPGIGRYVTHLAHELARLVSPTELALLTNPTASPFSIAQQWRIPAQLRRLRATLYHSPYYLMPYAPGVPTVLTVYDVIPLLYPHYYRPTQRLLYRAAHGLALHTARAVLAISEATRADFIRLFRVPPEKITVTPLAAAAHFAPRPAAEVEAMRQTLGLPDNYLLYFGSNKPHKNLVRLVSAYARLPAHTPPLLIAGHWEARYPEAQHVVEAQALSARVKFLGPIAEENLPALYSGATLFVFPSEYEGFGLPVLEALACGAPVACANTSSLPEVAGKAAWLFDPTAVEAITETLRRALADEAARMERRARGLQRAAQFTWAQTAAQTLAVYKLL